MRRYAITVLSLVAVFLIAAAGVSWFGLDQCPMSDRNVCGIYHFQKAKLAAAAAQVGDLNVLINNAGVLASYSVLASAPEAIEQDFAINVFGTLAATRAFLPAQRTNWNAL